MKLIELTPIPPNFDDLLRVAQQEDVLLLRDGRAIARLERFDDDDWEEWKYEHSPDAQERGRRAREQYSRGEYKTIDQVSEELGIEKDDQAP